MANKHIGLNDKDVAEQHVASIGAFQVDLQSWASNSVSKMNQTVWKRTTSNL